MSLGQKQYHCNCIIDHNNNNYYYVSFPLENVCGQTGGRLTFFLTTFAL